VAFGLLRANGVEYVFLGRAPGLFVGFFPMVGEYAHWIVA
jgi:hypothetical protein